MNETINIIKSHRSIRKFLNKPVSDEIVTELLISSQAASTSSFMQAFSVIKIDSIEKRKSIYALSGNQDYIVECPLFLVFCADLHKFSVACAMNNMEMAEGYTEAFIISTVDASLAAQNLFIAAESLGLGGVYIGGIRNNPEEISNLLKLPSNVYPVFGMCIGYPAETPELKPRLPLQALCFTDEYKLEANLSYLESYDKEISSYYKERTNGLRKDTWTEQMAKHVSKPLRPHMKAFLKNRVFLIK
jgi:nitroreductase